MTTGVTTGSAVITAAKYRADMVNSTFVTSTEWLSYLNNSYKELYDLLIQKYGNNWYVPTSPATPAAATVTADGTNDHYALPADIYHLLGVDLILSGSGPKAVCTTLKPFPFIERNSNAYSNISNWYGRTNLRYRLEGQWIWFRPFPPNGAVFNIWYMPMLADLDGTGSASTDNILEISGWSEYMVIDMALKAKQKEESDVSVLMAAKAAIIQRIESAAENRDAGSPATVADVYRGAYGDYGGESGGW